MCWKESGLHAQNVFKYSTHNSEHDWENLYDHLVTHKIFTLTTHKILIRAPKLSRKASYGHTLNILSPHLTLVAHFVSHEKDGCEGGKVSV